MTEAGKPMMLSERVGPEPSESEGGLVEIATRLGRVRGVERIGAISFWGIRFGLPPKRFQRPIPAGSWDGSYDATYPKAQALQEPHNPIFGPEPKGGYSEDCLFLNIHVPANANSSCLPVLFWVHGGAGKIGSANQYDGSALAVTANAVVVCTNYRLGIFGYLDLSELGGPYFDSGHSWLADQVLALTWVRDNIADYGGDPGCVTVMGESAGAESTLALISIPAARGLAHRAMAFSGAITARDRVADTPGIVAKWRKAGRRSAIDFLTESPPQALIDFQSQHPNLQLGCPPGQGRLWPEPVLDMVAARGSQAIPLVMGHQPHEAQIFSELMRMSGIRGLRLGVYERLIAIAAAGVNAGGLKHAFGYLRGLHTIAPIWSSAKMFDAVLSDVFRRASATFTLAATAAGSRGFRYELDVPCRINGKDMGSTHAADLPFTFNLYRDPSASAALFCQDPRAPALAERWARMIGCFARTGDPSGPLGDWPTYRPSERNTMMVSLAESRIVRDPDRAYRLGVWRDSQ